MRAATDRNECWGLALGGLGETLPHVLLPDLRIFQLLRQEIMYRPHGIAIRTEHTQAQAFPSCTCNHRI